MVLNSSSALQAEDETRPETTCQRRLESHEVTVSDHRWSSPVLYKDLHSNVFIRSRINIAFQCKRLSHGRACWVSDSIDMDMIHYSLDPPQAKPGPGSTPHPLHTPFPLGLGSVSSICNLGCQQHNLANLASKWAIYFGTIRTTIISLVSQRWINYVFIGYRLQIFLVVSSDNHEKRI